VDIKAGELEREKREEAIINSKYFVTIVTILAPDSNELKREIKLAKKLNKEIIVCRHKDVLKYQLSKLGLKEYQWIDFETKEDLARKVIKEIRRREMATLKIKTEPPGAKVYIDNEFVGYTRT